MELRRVKGQSLVEFSLIVPILILLVIGMAEFGRALMTKNILTGAAREAVRRAAVEQLPAVGKTIGETRGYEVLNSAGMGSASLIVTPAVNTHDPVTATVTYDFPLVLVGFIPGLDNSTITLTTTTTMRWEW